MITVRDLNPMEFRHHLGGRNGPFCRTCVLSCQLPKRGKVLCLGCGVQIDPICTDLMPPGLEGVRE